MYKVFVAGLVHSEHSSYEKAVITAGWVGGVIHCPSGLHDTEAWRYAARNQGFTGDYLDWTQQSDETRELYEEGARGGNTEN